MAFKKVSLVHEGVSTCVSIVDGCQKASLLHECVSTCVSIDDGCQKSFSIARMCAYMC